MKLCLAILLGIFRVVVIPVQTQDSQARLGEDRLKQDLATCARYLNEQLGAKNEIELETTAAVNLLNPISYYGANSFDQKDRFLPEAVTEACRGTDAVTDFASYDGDLDGYVDAVVVVFPGLAESDGGSEDAIWPRHLRMENSNITMALDGVKVNNVVCVTEERMVGTLCHEFMHIYDIPDMYDTDGSASGGESKALWGSTALMDRGGHNNEAATPPNLNAIEMEILGLGSREEMTVGEYTLEPINRTGRALKATNERSGDYFLFECRSNEDWDAHIGGRGMLVYHLDKSANYAGYSDYYQMTLTAYERWQRNCVNCRPDRQCADLVEAKPDATQVSEVFFPQPGRSMFASDTDPAFRFNNGDTSPLAITDISILNDGSIHFKVIEPVKLKEILEFQESALISWDCAPDLDVVSASIIWSDDDGKNGVTIREGAVVREADGSFHCRMEELEPMSSYHVSIHLNCRDGRSFSRNVTVRTKSRHIGTYPFIYLNNVERNRDGSFRKGSRIALQVYNAKPVEVRWYFNGNRIDGAYLTLETSGELKAEVYYENGGRDVILKEMETK